MDNMTVTNSKSIVVGLYIDLKNGSDRVYP